MTKRPEHHLQCRIMDYLNHNGRPELHWTAIPNGELRHPTVALRLRAEGVKPGTADIVILLPNQTAWLELKSPKGSLTWEQKGFAAKAMRLGHYWGMARSLPEAIAILKTWNVLKENAEEAA